MKPCPRCKLPMFYSDRWVCENPQCRPVKRETLYFGSASAIRNTTRK